MNRRKFLKRIAAVAAGAVAVPTMVKRIQFKPNPAQKLIIGGYDDYIKGQHSERAWVQYKGTWDEIPYHQVGKRYYTGDGRVYLYMKAGNRFVKEGELC